VKAGWGALELLALMQGGCTSAPPGSDPCQLDTLSCRGGASAFELDDDCPDPAPLAVELGDGQEAFRSLAEQQSPELHYGTQGGQHVFLAIRVAEPDPRHDRYEATLSLEVRGNDGQWAPQAERTLLFSAADAAVSPDGALELYGLVLQLPDAALQDPARLALDLRDSCDTRARVEHVFRW
jgi:hypothetical protein